MAPPIVLTPHQTEAVNFLADHLHDGDPIVALRGLAGCGKTSIIPALITVLEATGLPVTLGAPTHRAAMVLRKKGLAQADTVHSHALTPYFTGDYTKALRWLGGSCQCKIEALADAHSAVDGVPWLVAERLQVTGERAETVKSRARQHDPKKALESLGISGRAYFAGFGPKAGEGVLIIDEASMVGADMLALCREAFPQLCLIGDPGQLPPVKDAAVLDRVPGFQLTEVHRQAQDSAIIQLAYAAREGQPFWERIPCRVGEVEEYLGVAAEAFLVSPLIVWRNKVRLDCTRALRMALHYPPLSPTVGEPLVCRTSDPKARVDGFYNNALFRVVGVSARNPRLVIMQPDGQEDAEVHEVLVQMEETDGPNIDPDAMLFRYGYCLTAHTAQGGEWPTVYISKPDLMAQARKATAPGEDDSTLRQWAYTAITRAKTTLGFLRKHDFTATTLVTPQAWKAPPSSPEGDTPMPKMQQTPPITPPSAPMLSMEPDDIADPPVPESLADDAMVQPTPGVPLEAPTMAVAPSGGQAPSQTATGLPDGFRAHEALLQGFCQHLQSRMHSWLMDEHRQLTQGMDVTMSGIRDYALKVLQCNEHAEYQLSDALGKLREDGLQVLGAPYEMSLTVRTPAGIPLTLTIRQRTAAGLLDELTRLEAWLSREGYTASETGVAA